MKVFIQNIGEVDMPPGLRASCCDKELTPMDVRRTGDAIVILCPGCHRTVIGVDLPLPDDPYDFD